MPGEERKFRRRSIVAFIPTCNREREVAALHTSVLDGISAVDVGNGSGIGDTVVVGIDVEGSASVGVTVGDGMKTAVAVKSLAVDVPVGDVIGSAVDVDSLDADVSVGDGNGGAVIVTALDVDVSVWDGVGGATVLVTSLVTVGETGEIVGVEVSACGTVAGIQNSRQMNISRSMSAMTSLNRS